MAKMEFAGTIESEETMGGDLEQGGIILVECAEFDYALNQERRFDPEYWYELWNRGCFTDLFNRPTVRVFKHGQQLYPEASLPEMEEAYRNHQAQKREQFAALRKKLDERFRASRPTRK